MERKRAAKWFDTTKLYWSHRCSPKEFSYKFRSVCFDSCRREREFLCVSLAEIFFLLNESTRRKKRENRNEPRMKVIVRNAFRARFWLFDFLLVAEFCIWTKSLRLDFFDELFSVEFRFVGFGRDARFLIVSLRFSLGARSADQRTLSLKSICAMTDWSFVLGEGQIELCVIKLSKVTLDVIRWRFVESRSVVKLSEFSFLRIEQSSFCFDRRFSALKREKRVGVELCARNRNVYFPKTVLPVSVVVVVVTPSESDEVVRFLSIESIGFRFWFVAFLDEFDSELDEFLLTICSFGRKILSIEKSWLYVFKLTLFVRVRSSLVVSRLFFVMTMNFIRLVDWQGRTVGSSRKSETLFRSISL